VRSDGGYSAHRHRAVHLSMTGETEINIRSFGVGESIVLGSSVVSSQRHENPPSS